MKTLTLTTGSIFKNIDGRYMKVVGKHGAKSKIFVIDPSKNIAYEKFMSKEDVLTNSILVDGKMPSTKGYIKLSSIETALLKIINDGDTVASLSEKTEDLSKSQLAGHISILNRKGFLAIDPQTREFEKTDLSLLIL
jgi:hypothetical protein